MQRIFALILRNYTLLLDFTHCPPEMSHLECHHLPSLEASNTASNDEPYGHKSLQKVFQDVSLELSSLSSRPSIGTSLAPARLSLLDGYKRQKTHNKFKALLYEY
jgi:hypothetical protein